MGRFSSIWKSEANPLDALKWSFAPTSPPKQPKTSGPFAREKMGSGIKDPHSTESSHSSCAKAVTLPTRTELVENPSTETNSMMKISPSHTPEKVSSPWPMPVPIPTDLNFSSVLLTPLGWMESTAFLERLLRDLMSLTKLKWLEAKAARQRRVSLLRIVESFN